MSTAPFATDAPYGWPGLTRASRWCFATGDHDSCVWWKHGTPEGTQVVSLYEIEGRAHLSPDGNWNNDVHPLHPACTFDEAARMLNQQALAPRIVYGRVNGEPVYAFDIWPASLSDPFDAWSDRPSS